MKKTFIWMISITFLCLGLIFIYTQLNPRLEIPQITSTKDADADGLDDYSDLVRSAKEQIGVVLTYDTSYYGDGGYPPSNTGACADVIWRAFAETGYDIRQLVDADIQSTPTAYENGNVSDANINFRRTQNLQIFFERNGETLTNKVEPWNETNLSEWQGGDIVTFAQIPGGLWHIAIVSDKRRADGVPYLIHNYGHGVLESDYLLDWPTEITGHYRWNTP